MPKERPVVPKAEATSTMIEIKGRFSVADKKTTAKKHIIKDNMKTTIDFLTSSSSILRLKTLISSSLFKKANKYKPIIATVVVRTPPPTELGLQPININTEKIINVVIWKSPKSLIWRPAFRVVIE